MKSGLHKLGLRSSSMARYLDNINFGVFETDITSNYDTKTL